MIPSPVFFDAKHRKFEKIQKRATIISRHAFAKQVMG